MFLQLYRATQTYSWYDITLEGTDPDTGEYCPGHGEEITVTYGYAIQPDWFRAQDGGQGGRKDGFDISTSVERVSSLPDGCVSVNQATFIEWLTQMRDGVFGSVRWNWLMRPRRYWLPTRYSSGYVSSSGLQDDLSSLWKSVRWRIWGRWS